MKVTLDLSNLVEEGKLLPAEAERLRLLASHGTSLLAINILVGFGIVAVTTGSVALVPTPATALILGLAVFAIGLSFILQRSEQWSAPKCTAGTQNCVRSGSNDLHQLCPCYCRSIG
jgi:hypothetical protein